MFFLDWPQLKATLTEITTYTYPSPLFHLVQPLFLAQGFPLSLCEEFKEDFDEAPVTEQGVHLPAVDALLVAHHLTHDLPHLHQLLVPHAVPHRGLGYGGYGRGRCWVCTDIVSPTRGLPLPRIKHVVVLNQLAFA